ncbi:MAG: hypothetical protein IJ737_02785 [Ruminococcus sp.]|nr:hypothetical protein [Ruminococcus sp.]
MAQISLQRIANASKAECQRAKKIRLINIILAISGTLFTLAEVSKMTIEKYNGDGEVIGKEKVTYLSSGFGIFLLIVLALLGTATVLELFKDLISKQEADVQLSLPLSAKERFFSKLLALAKLQILPVICSGVIMTAGTILRDGFAHTGEVFGMMGRISVLIFALTLFIDALSIFCMCCCGAKAEGLYTSEIALVCLSFTPMLVYMYNILGFSGRSGMITGEMKYFSILGVLVFFAWFPNPSTGTSRLAFVDLPNKGAPIFISLNIIVSLLIILAAYCIYVRRDAKKVGKPVVSKLFLELFMIIGLMTLFTFFFALGIWQFGILISLVIYFVIRIVEARAKLNVKTFLIWLGKYALTFAGFIAITAVGYFTGGFGQYKTMPRINSCDDITINVYVSNSLGRSYNFRMSYNNKEEAQENIDALHDIIDETYDLSMRSMDGFFSRFFRRGSLMDGYSDDSHVDDDSMCWANISIYGYKGEGDYEKQLIGWDLGYEMTEEDLEKLREYVSVDMGLPLEYYYDPYEEMTEETAPEGTDEATVIY